MAHAASAFSFRSDHVPTSAVALAVLLHGLVALAVWWLSLQQPSLPTEEAIEVTIEQPRIEQPKPEPPPPPPQPQRQAPTPLPPVEGLRPPAPIIADKPTQVPPSGERPDEPPAPPPPPLVDALPAPEPPPPPPTATELAKPAPVMPKPPPQAPSGQREALVAPQPHPPPAPPPPKPAPQPQPQPQLQRPELRPSPLTIAPTTRPPAGRPGESPTHSPFVNPADAYNRARVADNYLWEVVRRLQGYRYMAHVNARQGLTVVRVVIARDGRLLDVTVTRSSGYPEFDRGVIEGVRSGSPYAPLPPEIQGDSAAFDLPLVSVHRE